MSRLTAVAGLLASLLLGCSATRPYLSDAEDNLFIATHIESGILSGVAASIDVYAIGDNCETHYRGTVSLDDSKTKVGVETGVPVQLVFRFESSSFFAGSRSSMDYDVVLFPEFGHHYDIDVSYRDDIYNVEVRERPRGRSEGTPMIVRRETQGCHNQA